MTGAISIVADAVNNLSDAVLPSSRCWALKWRESLLTTGTPSAMDASSTLGALFISVAIILMVELPRRPQNGF